MANLEACMERLLEEARQQTNALKNMELRLMKSRLTGAEASRLLAVELQTYRPHGPVETWRSTHSRRCILELMAVWRQCNEAIATPYLWSLIVESSYKRALEESTDT